MGDIYKDYINISEQGIIMIYLYLKEHLTTGMKYLGQTKKNPLKYKGSGKYWKRHLKIHGNNVKTTILGEYQTIEDLRIDGQYYSNLWNIVDSDEWANLIPETGDGNADPRLNEAYLKKWQDGAFSRSGIDNPNFGKIFSEEERKVLRDGWATRIAEGHTPWNKGVIYNEERLSKLRVPHPNSKGKSQTAEHIAARKKALKGRMPSFKDKTHSEETKQAQRKAALNRLKKECPHCGKTVAVNAYNRWHSDNCKYK